MPQEASLKPDAAGAAIAVCMHVCMHKKNVAQCLLHLYVVSLRNFVSRIDRKTGATWRPWPRWWFFGGGGGGGGGGVHSHFHVHCVLGSKSLPGVHRRVNPKTPELLSDTFGIGRLRALLKIEEKQQMQQALGPQC